MALPTQIVHGHLLFDLDGKFPNLFPAISGRFCASGRGYSTPLAIMGEREPLPVKDTFNKNGNGIEHIATKQDMPLIRLEAMQAANDSLEYFCKTYLMFHGLDAKKPESLFKYLPILSFIEAFVYQLDNLNEKIVIDESIAYAGVSDSEDYSTKIDSTIQSNPFRPLKLLLQREGLLTERITQFLKNGEEYWALERKLCTTPKHVEISIEDVLRTMEIRTFDFRVLNLLLYQLRGEKVNEQHMEFLRVTEILVELIDDVFDYKKDVRKNSFNILRMFVRIYGITNAPTMLAKYISELEEKYHSLLKELDPKLAESFQRRFDEYAEEGWIVTGYSLGSLVLDEPKVEVTSYAGRVSKSTSWRTWTMPQLIEDEELYRSSKSSNDFSVIAQ